MELNPNDTSKRRRPSRMRGLVGTVAALGALALFAPSLPALASLPLLTADAHAAYYAVPVCNDAGGVNNSWGYTPLGGGAEIAHGQGCPNSRYTGNTNAGMFVRNVADNGSTPYGSGGKWQFTAPAGNTVQSISFDGWITRGTFGHYAGLLTDSTMVAGCWQGSSLCLGLPSGPGRYSFNAYDSSEIRTEVGCLNGGGCANAGQGTSGIVELYGATVYVHDLTTPSVSPAGSMWTGNWQRGVQSIGMNASDGADGISSTHVYVDGNDILSQGGSCDYTRPSPCGSASPVWSYNTAQLADGPHSIEVRAVDGGGSTGLTNSGYGTIYVDNHAPERSADVAVAGGQTWHTTNSFGVSWTNPSQGSAAPIVAAHYSLCRADNPSNCPVADQRVAGADIDSLSGVQAPARGDYLMRVWTEDAAGNVNPDAVTDPVHVMYDDQAPGQAEPAHANGWINAQDAKSYPEPLDLALGAKQNRPISGIKGYSLTVDGSKPDNSVEATGEKLTYRLDQLPEGRNLLQARAVTNAGVGAADSDIGAAELDVDKTPPTVSASGAPSPDQWQPQAVTLQLTGVDQAGLSGMTPAPASDDTVTDGAYIAYRVDGGSLQRERGGDIRLPVLADGEHTVSYQAFDLAGNASSERSVGFKIDQTAPELVAFAARDARDPRALNVVAADRTSGVDGGVIEIRKVGGSDWTALPTTQTGGGHFAARLDDTHLDRNAMYEARARMRDVAGNQTIGSAYSNGAPVVFSGSLRETTKVSAQFVSAACSSKKAKKHAKSKGHAKRAVLAKKKAPKRTASSCAKSKAKSKAKPKRHAKRAVVAKTKRHEKAPAKKPAAATPVVAKVVPFGKRTHIEGTLTIGTGAPIANADLVVDATLDMAGATAHRESVVRTDSKGRFSYDAPAGASRKLAFDYEGSNVLLPGSGGVSLQVPASASFRSKPRVARLHHRVVFSGRLRTLGAPLPTVGKLVYLQAFDRGKWRKFAVLRTRADGYFSYRFTFEAAGSRGVTYPIKAVVPREAGYAFQTGESKPVRIKVRG